MCSTSWVITVADILIKGGNPYLLLEYLYDRQGKWVLPSELYGSNAKFPKRANGTPAAIARRGYILKEKLADGNRTKIKITKEGIKAYELARDEHEKQITPDEIAVPDKIKLSPKDLYKISRELTKPERTLLKHLLYENAFAADSARSLSYISHRLHITDLARLTADLASLVSKRLVIALQGDYFLNANGIKIAEAVVMRGVEFTNDSLEALLLNPLGRKVIHFLEEGKTINQLAEEIGYSIEESYIEDYESMEDRIRYSVHKVYQLVDRLWQFGLVELYHHQTVEGSTRIVKINNHETIEILAAIATLVEFLPTLLREDDKVMSVLRLVVEPDEIENAFGVLRETEPIPPHFRGKVATTKRVAYWLSGTPIEQIEKAAKSWKMSALKENGGIHYFMVHRNPRNAVKVAQNLTPCYNEKCKDFNLNTCGRPEGKCKDAHMPTKPNKRRRQ
jgi:hypothetical protein